MNPTEPIHHSAVSEKIKNQITGQIIRFFEKDLVADDILEMESTYPSLSSEPPMHFHPMQTEVFEIVSGTLIVKMRNGISILSTGDSITILPNEAHSMWNSGLNDTVVNWQVYPALNTKQFLKTIFTLANSGKTNADGVPSILWMIFILKRFQNIIGLINPNQKLVNVLYFILSPLLRFKKLASKIGY